MAIPNQGFFSWYIDRTDGSLAFDSADYIIYNDDIIIGAGSGAGSLRFQAGSPDTKFYPQSTTLVPSISLFSLGANNRILVSTDNRFDFIVKFFFKTSTTGNPLEFYMGMPGAGQQVGAVMIKASQVEGYRYDGSSLIPEGLPLLISPGQWYELEIVHRNNNTAFQVNLYFLTFDADGKTVNAKTLTSQINYGIIPNRRGEFFFFRLATAGQSLAKIDFFRAYAGIF